MSSVLAAPLPIESRGFSTLTARCDPLHIKECNPAGGHLRRRLDDGDVNFAPLHDLVPSTGEDPFDSKTAPIHLDSATAVEDRSPMAEHSGSLEVDDEGCDPARIRHCDPARRVVTTPQIQGANLNTNSVKTPVEPTSSSSSSASDLAKNKEEILDGLADSGETKGEHCDPLHIKNCDPNHHGARKVNEEDTFEDRSTFEGPALSPEPRQNPHLGLTNGAVGVSDLMEEDGQDCDPNRIKHCDSRPRPRHTRRDQLLTGDPINVTRFLEGRNQEQTLMVAQRRTDLGTIGPASASPLPSTFDG